MNEDRKALADEIERLTRLAGSGCATAHELLSARHGEWSPEHGTRFRDEHSRKADQGLRAAQALCEVIRTQVLAALRSDAAAEMRERCAVYLDGRAVERTTVASGLTGQDAVLCNAVGAAYRQHAAAIRAIPTESEGRAEP